jgi:hypothetical protein
VVAVPIAKKKNQRKILWVCCKQEAEKAKDLSAPLRIGLIWLGTGTRGRLLKTV